jgi:hypothetical protein
MVLLSQLLKQNLRTTASPTLITLPNKLRRSSLLVPESLRPVSQTKAASRTRSGPTPRQLPRRKKRTSLLDPAERPSVSASVSRSSSLTLTSDSSRLPSVVDVVVDSAVAEAVVMVHPVAAEVNSEGVVTEVVIEDVRVETTEALLVAVQETTLPVHPSTPPTLLPSPALGHRVLATVLIGSHTVQILVIRFDRENGCYRSGWIFEKIVMSSRVYSRWMGFSLSVMRGFRKKKQCACLRLVLQSCIGWIQNILVGFGSNRLACNGRTKYFF